MVAPARFELTSQDPESRMIDRYTTGLCYLPLKCFLFLTLFIGEQEMDGKRRGSTLPYCSCYPLIDLGDGPLAVHDA